MSRRYTGGRIAALTVMATTAPKTASPMRAPDVLSSVNATSVAAGVPTAIAAGCCRPCAGDR